MATQHDFSSFSQGAEFRRADLHIHSYGVEGSYDVTDQNMTPAGIIDAAIKEQLSVIAIADHNEIGNVPAALSYAVGKPILVVPAVELSTSQGHLLTYFPDFASLKKFFGKLTISPDRKACSETIDQCLRFAAQFGGFGVLAHIELEAGFDGAMKSNQFKEQVLCSDALLGLEVAKKETEPWYSARDEDPERKRLHNLRIERLKFESDYEIAKLMSSDAHSISAFGRNAGGNKKLTRIKMEELSFAALLVAMHDPTARVRIEDVIPQDVPRFVGIRLSGGFLRDQIVRFSKNLTCIIGGRGAGKSTLLECLRITAGAKIRRQELVDSEVWPDKIELLYQDEAEQQHLLVRESFGDTVNTSDPFEGITKIRIESYGQGDTAETIQHCDKDPGVLLQFLDEFVEIGSLREEDETVREQLLDNQTKLENLQLDVKAIPDVERAKKHAESQVNALKEKDASKLVELEGKLANGRKFREQLVIDLKQTVRIARDSLASHASLEVILPKDPSELPVGKHEFDLVSTVVMGLSENLRSHSAQIKSACDTALAKIDGLFKDWIAAETKIQEQIDEIRKELEAKGVKLDVTFIRKVTKDVAEHGAKLQQLKNKQAEIEKLAVARRALLAQRQQIKHKIFTERSRLATSLENNLKKTVVDFAIGIRFQEGVHSPQLEEIIKVAMEWRTSRVPRAAIIARAFSPLRLAAIVKSKEISAIADLRDDGGQVFNSSDASQIVERLADPSILFSIERCEFEDRPDVKVSKTIFGTEPKPKIFTKDFGKLSLGQQQAILLSIMLFSRNKSPLIIDQPEDNLDSEFVYKTFVRTLRTIKETRQVIVVTHNANIAVLGDAELIVPLKATNEQSVIQQRGSIDTPETRDLACAILEGSADAFKKRERIYGFDRG